METLLIRYDVKSEIIRKVFEMLSKVMGARIIREYTLTEEEKNLIEKSLASGVCTTDISELQDFLRSEP